METTLQQIRILFMMLIDFFRYHVDFKSVKEHYGQFTDNSETAKKEMESFLVDCEEEYSEFETFGIRNFIFITMIHHRRKREMNILKRTYNMKYIHKMNALLSTEFELYSRYEQSSEFLKAIRNSARSLKISFIFGGIGSLIIPAIDLYYYIFHDEEFYHTGRCIILSLSFVALFIATIMIEKICIIIQQSIRICHVLKDIHYPSECLYDQHIETHRDIVYISVPESSELYMKLMKKVINLADIREMKERECIVKY